MNGLKGLVAIVCVCLMLGLEAAGRREIAVSVIGVERPALPPVAESVPKMVRYWTDAMDAEIGNRPDLVVLPECCDVVSREPKARAAWLRLRGDAVLDAIRGYAAKHGCYIVYSSLRDRGDGRYANSSRLIDRKGEVVACYDKVFPTTGEMEDPVCPIVPGEGPVVVDTDFGRVGFAICFDLNFPELRRAYAEKRPDVICFSSFFDGDFQQRAWARDCESWIVSSTGENWIEKRIVDPAGGLRRTEAYYQPTFTERINTNCRVLHLDFNREKFPALQRKYGARVTIRNAGTVGTVTLASNDPALPVDEVVRVFKLETFADYLLRARRTREAALDTAAHRSEVVLENARFRLTVGGDATVRSLVVKATGEELISQDERLPIASIRQNRTYDNEHQLTYPVNPRAFPASRAWLEGGKLKLGFIDRFDVATIGVKTTPDYICFTLEKTDFVCKEDLIVKKPTQLDGFTFMQLPVRRKSHFGEWMNVAWDERSAVALMGVSPETHIGSEEGETRSVLKAGAEHGVRLYGTGAALIVDRTDAFLDRVDAFERDFGLPRGVESRRREGADEAVWESRYLTPACADKAIAYAKQGGFEMFRIYYPNFAKTCGHYDWREDYPNGLADLQSVVGKIRAAGMKPGFHIHYNKVTTNDAYVASACPDTRVATVRDLTLARGASIADTTLYVEEDPTGMRMEDGRRIVQIGREWVTYGGFTVTPPYALTNCLRGVHGSCPSAYAQGTRFRLVDADDWPLFIRLDQNSSLPDELAKRMASLWNVCGFEYLYFDGAEDVPEPYWYNVPRAQYRVWRRFDRKPLWAEGALKSHFGWHMLSRGNAFDHFATHRMREAVKRYFLPCARLNRDNFTRVNFGWIPLKAPGKDEIGMRPEILEYLLSKATAFSSPLTVAADVRQLDASPYTAANLAMIRLWQEARRAGFFTEEMRRRMEDPDRDFHLVRTPAGFSLARAIFQRNSAGYECGRDAG